MSNRQVCLVVIRVVYLVDCLVEFLVVIQRRSHLEFLVVILREFLVVYRRVFQVDCLAVVRREYRV